MHFRSVAGLVGSEERLSHWDEGMVGFWALQDTNPPECSTRSKVVRIPNIEITAVVFIAYHNLRLRGSGKRLTVLDRTDYYTDVGVASQLSSVRIILPRRARDELLAEWPAFGELRRPTPVPRCPQQPWYCYSSK